MKIPKISHKRVLELVEYDPLTGIFRWKVHQGLGRAGVEVGTIQFGYRKTFLDKEQIRLHRLAWFITHGTWPEGQIDHIDGNKLNNAIANLRDVSQSTNMQNRYAIKRKNSHLPMGVTSNGHGKFNANIKLGVFNTIEEASAAYMRAKRLFHEGCTR